MEQSIWGIIGNIDNQVDQYDNNLRQINRLESEEDRLLSELCYTIFSSKQEILQLLEDNSQYLSFLPSASVLDNVIDDLNNDKIKTMAQVKLLQQLLDAINKHKVQTKRNLERSQNENVLKRFTRLVREDCEDVN